MIPDTVLKLGDISFASFEVPESIRFGGSQSMSVKKLIGGKRIIDIMGPDDLPPSWSGVFFGPSASSRAQFLDSMRAGGQQQKLTWGTFSYLVVIHEFEADCQRLNRISYRIVCEVITNDTNPPPSVPPPPIDQALQTDFNSAQGLGGLIGDDTLSGLLGGLDTAISAVSSFANAAQSTINSVLLPLNAVQQRVGTLMTASELTLQNTSTFGGVLPNTPFSQVAGKLTGQTNTALQMTNLVQLQGVTGRMGANLVAINSPQATVTTAGGNLFNIANQQYGDATAWTAIARANGTTDPFIDGIATLKIPPRPDQSGGVLND